MSRYYFLDDSFPNIDINEARHRRDTTGCGLQEASKQMRREQLRNALNVLHAYLVAGEDADKVLYDLIEVVKELIP